MDEFILSDNIEKLESVFLNILYLKPEERIVKPNYMHLSDVRDALNNVFVNIKCIDVTYTNNTDKLFFGIHINPIMTAQDAIAILTTDEKIDLKSYQVELDSKLFDLELSSTEIVAILLYEISSMMDSYQAIDTVRSLIDLYVLSNDDIIHIRDSVNYSQLIIYALKDTLYKVSSIMFKSNPEEITSNSLIQTAELEDSLLSAQEKILNSSYGIGDGVRPPKTIILQWMFIVYKDMMHNSGAVKETLKDAKEFTGSRLEKAEIDKTIDAIDKITSQSLAENVSLNKLFDSKCMYSVNEISIFKSLKQSGLRGIEDALYEYAMRIKNLETEEDAMYILRGINTRLSIIEDYLYTTNDLSESERKHWEMVAYKYRQLREELSKKKIWKQKSYGLFFDYNQTFGDEEQ